MPRPRQRAANATSSTQARSPSTCATANPTTSSATTATTAGWPARADAITSETGKTGRVPSACRLWSQTWMAWSRSSSWKSRNRHAGIPNPLGSSRSLTASGFGVDPVTGVAPE